MLKQKEIQLGNVFGMKYYFLRGKGFQSELYILKRKLNSFIFLTRNVIYSHVFVR